MSFRADPEICWYTEFGGNDCPFEKIAYHLEVAERLKFATTSIEMWTHTDPHTKVEEPKYAVSPERFQMALKMYGVPLRPNDPPSEFVDFRNGIHAFDVVRKVAEALADAPKQVLVQARKRRRGGDEDGE